MGFGSGGALKGFNDFGKKKGKGSMLKQAAQAGLNKAAENLADKHVGKNKAKAPASKAAKFNKATAAAPKKISKTGNFKGAFGGGNMEK